MIRRSEKFWLGLIAVTLLLPAALTLWVHCGNPSPRGNWLANRTLSGVTVKKDLPAITIKSWLNGQLQKGLNTSATEDFAGRELLIRAYNQFLYGLFDKSYMTSGVTPLTGQV